MIFRMFMKVPLARVTRVLRSDRPAGVTRRALPLRLLIHEVRDLLKKLAGILVAGLFQDDVLLDSLREVAELQVGLPVVLTCFGEVRFQLQGRLIVGECPIHISHLPCAEPQHVVCFRVIAFQRDGILKIGGCLLVLAGVRGRVADVVPVRGAARACRLACRSAAAAASTTAARSCRENCAGGQKRNYEENAPFHSITSATRYADGMGLDGLSRELPWCRDNAWRGAISPYLEGQAARSATQAARSATVK